MRVQAACLLTIFFLAVVVAASNVTTSPTLYNGTTTMEFRTTVRQAVNMTAANAMSSENKFINYARPFTNVRDILMQEIRTLDEDAADVSDAKVRVASRVIVPYDFSNSPAESDSRLFSQQSIPPLCTFSRHIVR